MYECTEDLLFDLRKVEHVMAIGLGKSHETEIHRFIRTVEEICREIDICPYCIQNYYSSGQGSVLTCPWGHALVLVDLSGKKSSSFHDFNFKKIENLPPLFPGKILCLNRKENSVRVRLFGPGALRRYEWTHSYSHL